MTRFLISFLLLISFFSSSSQIQIWLNDGTILSTTHYRIDSLNKIVYYQKHSSKLNTLDFPTVFAIIDKQDTFIVSKPQELTTSQAFRFLRGVHDGYHYKNTAILLSNMGLGIVSGFTLPMIGMSGVYSVIPNLISTIIFTSTNVKDKKITAQDTFYRKGYRFSSRKKRLIIAAEGSLIGLTTGTVIGYIIKAH